MTKRTNRPQRPLCLAELESVRGGAIVIIDPDAEASKTDQRRQSLYFPE